MTENKIEISVEEYNELVRATERIATVQRMVAKNVYINVDDVKAILGIETKGEDQ